MWPFCLAKKCQANVSFCALIKYFIFSLILLALPYSTYFTLCFFLCTIYGISIYGYQGPQWPFIEDGSDMRYICHTRTPRTRSKKLPRSADSSSSGSQRMNGENLIWYFAFNSFTWELVHCPSIESSSSSVHSSPGAPIINNKSAFFRGLRCGYWILKRIHNTLLARRDRNWAWAWSKLFLINPQ